MQTPGRWTGCALENTDALAFSLSAASPHTAPFRHEAARLSLELAATSYDLDVTPWQQAGWQDFSYQLDHALMTGQRLNQSEGSRLRNTVSEWMHRLARHRGHRADPIAQVRGALRQRENGDACRAVVMLRQEGAHCIVAIGFMGTRRLLSDWVSNLRVQRQDDMHQGFLQLAESFEDACAEIRFPSAAQAMGLAELTLADILMACTRPESPFRIWMAGHSQGAAVMEIFAWHLLQAGVLPQHVVGYGFASPTVTYLPCLNALAACPVYNLIGSDDLTPRVGARWHIGRCYTLTMTDALRAACYGEADGCAAFPAVLSFTHTLTDTRATLMFVIALLRVLREQGETELLSLFASSISRFLPERMADFLGDHTDAAVLRLSRATERSLLGATGETALPQTVMEGYALRVRRLVARHGAKAFLQAVALAFAAPHHLHSREPGGAPSVYQRMTGDLFCALRPGEGCVQTPPFSAFPTYVPVRAPRRKKRYGRTIAGQRRHF